DLFFFQADDGIRDFHVTGVQTCALPISMKKTMLGALMLGLTFLQSASAQAPDPATNFPDRPIHLLVGSPPGASTDTYARIVADEIGRASCRQRGWGVWLPLQYERQGSR